MSQKPGLYEWLMRIFTALSNCLKEPMLSLLSIRGYTAERINGILDIQKDVVRLDGIKDEAYQKQYSTTDALTKLFGGVKETYLKLRKLAQVALKAELTTLKFLQLSIDVKSGLSVFVAQVRVFYNAVVQNDELAAKLLSSGLTREEVAAELPKLEQMEQLNVQQEFDKKAAQDATEKRDDRLDELEKEYAGLYKVGKVALEGEKQYLEMLDLNRHN
ncbi:MAG: hypothetical protein GY950_21340 [bacterium]|nr:hypothetical protein [bacterium]